ncbi:peptidase [Bacillus sp. FJAT-42376]|uniref:DUF1796 family putative cysteine peptidase n=1 Tax=Bacillus sp. FJAT-42376 TaxID=2014076 RepID=UPI000F4DB53A|nr:DUF1796 family putative cysteine peptidase [Bacillus sp. FJAT-42376]AZB43225.1 peptidase [Bacillus sp. FJAT-42376]
MSVDETLDKIKGSYDAVISLGDLCLSSIQLKKNSLRNFSGVLDWMASPRLNDVNRLLKNRFIGFFDEDHLRIIGYAAENIICVADDVYNLVSNHDFMTEEGNTLTYLGSYADVMEKYDRRIRRTLEKFDSANRILFVRTEGSYEDALELQNVLSQLVANDFRVLMINHTNVNEITDSCWGLEKICAVELPGDEKWNANDHLWAELLKDVTLSSDSRSELDSDSKMEEAYSGTVKAEETDPEAKPDEE